jgi:uncharacterized integral membrane protein (TIGR00697 family)
MAIDLQKSANPKHPFKYYDLFGMLSVCVLMISNTTAQKMMSIGPFTLNAAIIIFPITYIISDLMTEVYGYARARRVAWASITGVILMSLMYQLIIAMPYIPEWKNQDAFEKVLGATPRIVFASVTALFIGDIVNCYVLAKMKIVSEGKHMWMRFIGSTIIAEGVDSVVFFTIAFAGVLPVEIMMSALLTGWFVKTLYEVVMLPVTYRIVNKLKQVEGVDFYDVNTNFTPFSLKIDEGAQK